MYRSLQLEPFVDLDEWQDGPSSELSEVEIEAAYLGWAADAQPSVASSSA